MQQADTLQGIGTDIIEIQRIREAIGRHGNRFLDRIYSQTEQDYCLRYKDSVPSFAGRFAAKEAIVKAFGTGIRPEITWTEIEIINDKHGKPEVRLSKRLQERYPRAKFFISISHCDSYATATAVALGI